ncbi:MAG: flagellar hook-basal body complex protein [Deltaproteobacteria bacterium]|nr:flagellar hook-basal body complex protein [Deltaproteobacteria bacterium]
MKLAHHALSLVLALTSLGGLVPACADGGRGGGDGGDPALAGYPDELVLPATLDPPEDEEVGTSPCVFDDDHWACRLNVEGAGFFALDLGEGRRAYSRTVRARIGAEGLVDAYDLPIFVYEGDGGGPDLGAPVVFRPETILPPRATSAVALDVNLNRADYDGFVAVFDTSDPEGTSQYQQSLTVFDSLGEAHQIEIYFTQTAPGQWAWNAMCPFGDIDGTDNGDGLVVAAGSMVFDDQGRLQTGTQVQSGVTFFGAEPQDLTFDFGSAIDDGGDGSGSSSYAAASSLNDVLQDGYPAGWLAHLSVDFSGALVAVYTNGRTVTLGRLAVALFDAPSELAPIAPHVWLATSGSGPGALGPAADGSRGSVRSWSLLDAP